MADQSALVSGFGRLVEPGLKPHQRECQSPQNDPNASKQNIGCVGSPYVGAHAGHVHFMFFVSISVALGSQYGRNFEWNMGLH